MRARLGGRAPPTPGNLLLIAWCLYELAAHLLAAGVYAEISSAAGARFPLAAYRAMGPVALLFGACAVALWRESRWGRWVVRLVAMYAVVTAFLPAAWFRHPDGYRSAGRIGDAPHSVLLLMAGMSWFVRFRGEGRWQWRRMGRVVADVDGDGWRRVTNWQGTPREVGAGAAPVFELPRVERAGNELRVQCYAGVRRVAWMPTVRMDEFQLIPRATLRLGADPQFRAGPAPAAPLMIPVPSGCWMLAELWTAGACGGWVLERVDAREEE